MPELLSLVLIVLFAMLSPGPDMVLLTRFSLGPVPRQADLCVAGIVLGISAHSLFALTGLAALTQLHPKALAAMTVLGALWLSYLAYHALQSQGALRLSAVDTPKTGLPLAFLSGLLSNLLNAKVLLMMVALFTELLPPTATLGQRLLGVLVLGIEVAMVWLLFVRLIRRPALREAIERYGSWVDRAFGALLLVLAVLFMLSALPTLLA